MKLKSKLIVICVFIISAVFAYELGLFISDSSEIRKLTKQKIKHEIELLKIQIELNDLELQKEY